MSRFGTKLREFVTGEQASVSMPAKLIVSIMAMAAIGALAYTAYDNADTTVR